MKGTTLTPPLLESPAPQRRVNVSSTGQGIVPAVRLSGLVKSYGSTPAVDGIDLEIKPGETVALLGPNGAGKSTTIAMLLGLLTPDQGRVEIAGMTPRRAVATGRIGAMLQESGMMPGVRVGELLRFVRSLYARPLSLTELVEAAGLDGVLQRQADRLSGGQSQRVRFAMAIAGDPSVVVLDEPTSAMDVEARRAFWELIQRLSAAGRTILFATHYLEEADAAADRIVVIARGRRVADGTSATLKAALGDRRVRLTVDSGEADLEQLDGVRQVQRHGQRITLYTDDSDATVRSLVHRQVSWRDLEVESPDLEQAFLTLVGEAS
ncbi:MAG: ABC transporter ATP-binding protein [Candidatus Dormibacteraeota bacterium]|nr:ABC transporter ATP-binding protein [Candidatus Dormibacteraeota bacterium]